MNITRVDERIQDSDAVLSWGERCCYGMGIIPIQLVGGLMASFAMIYMTNVALLDMAVLSVLMALSKGLDGISDVVVGNIIDNTNSKYGKARVWILRTCVPFAVSLVLLFTVPQTLPNMAKYVYFFVMYNLVNTCFYTFAQIAHYSLLSLITSNSVEHGILSVVSSLIQSAVQVLIGVSFVPLLNFFSKDPSNPYTQSAFFYSVAIFGVLAVVCGFISFWGTKERVAYTTPFHEKKKGMNWIDTLKVLLRNKYWAVFLVIAIISNFLLACNITGDAYYATYVLKDPMYIGLIMVCLQAPSIVIRFIVPALLKRIGNFGVQIIGTMVMVIGCIGVAIVAPNVTGLLFFLCVKSIGLGLSSSSLLGVIADIIKYTEKRDGVFSAGLGNAGLSASNKLGIGIGTVFFGFTMSRAGFDALKGIAQPPAVLDAISFFFVTLPLILEAIILVLLLVFFNRKSDIRKA